MKNSKLSKIAGFLFALALLVASSQPLFAQAYNDGGSGGDREKTEKTREKDKADKGKKHDDSKRKCFPWGFFHPQGIDKRFDDGKGFPFGLFKKFTRCENNGNGYGTTTATTTPDTRDPRISSISVSRATSTVSISWKTDELTTGSVRYGTTSAIVSGSAVQNDGSLTTGHSVGITGLAADTIYYYVIVARDASGNTEESAIRSFKTNKIPTVSESDTRAPQIAFVTAANIKATSTQIIWITDESSDSKIWISTTTSVDTSIAPAASSSAFSHYHNLALNGLATSTTYYYTVISADSSGNKGTLTGNSFQTLAQ